MKTCETCRYFELIDEDEPIVGTCYRYPPILVESLDWAEARGWSHPTVEGNGRCGEHQERRDD